MNARRLENAKLTENSIDSRILACNELKERLEAQDDMERQRKEQLAFKLRTFDARLVIVERIVVITVCLVGLALGLAHAWGWL